MMTGVGGSAAIREARPDSFSEAPGGSPARPSLQAVPKAVINVGLAIDAVTASLTADDLGRAMAAIVAVAGFEGILGCAVDRRGGAEVLLSLGMNGPAGGAAALVEALAPAARRRMTPFDLPLKAAGGGAEVDAGGPGLVVPIHAAGRCAGFLAFFGPAPDRSPEVRTALHLLSYCAHERAALLHRLETLRRA